jgi:murein DD-endopeptidase MepM/ murein hydrolase activator NlpD
VLRATLRLLRHLPALALLVLCASAFVVLTSLLGARLGSGAKVALGLGGVLGLPLALALYLRLRVARRVGARPLSGRTLLALWNLALLALLCLGLSDASGRALRRRGDWFLGEAEGWLAGRYRRGVALAAAWMERFDLPPAARRALAPPAPAPRPEAPPPGPVEPSRPAGPPRPVEVASWLYPLAGEPRPVTRYAIQRFGAVRRGWNPPECEGGHCGIDLQQPRGTPVHAVHDAVVLKLVRTEVSGRGLHLQLAHLDGEVMTAYLHLDTIRGDLRVGSTVERGRVIGTVGSTGLTRGGAHLHFELAIREGGGYRFLDPEPIVASWPRPEEPIRRLPLAGPLRAEENRGPS